MWGITDLSTYVIGTIAVILLPGPNSMFCLSVAAQYGARAAYRVVVAIIIGDALLMCASVLGAGTVLRTNPELFTWLKYLGAAYLGYIGITLLHAALKKWQMDKRPTMPTTTVRPKRVFAKALTLSLSNPKAILFFVSFFVQFVDVNYAHPYWSFVILGVILQCISFIYLSFLILTGTQLVAWFRRKQRVGALGMGGIGTMFIGFAAKLWTTSLT